MKVQEILEKEDSVIRRNVEVDKSTTRLVYAGFRIEGSFDCSYSDIKSLIGSPKEVSGFFSCIQTSIKSLKGAPKRVGGRFVCPSCPFLTSLEGAPRYIGSEFFCQDTAITDLHDIHKQIGYIGGVFYIPNIKDSILGVLRIKGLPMIEHFDSNLRLDKVVGIVNQHLHKGRDIHKCQEELIEAGFEEYTRL